MQGKTETEIQKFSTLFSEIQKVVDSKQLNPMIRTQYMRTAFQIPFDATVRISLDTNLAMIKENPDDGPSCAISGRQASLSKHTSRDDLSWHLMQTCTVPDHSSDSAFGEQTQACQKRSIKTARHPSAYPINLYPSNILQAITSHEALA